MKKIVLGLLSMTLFNGFAQSKSIDKVYQANWESVKQHQTPDWFVDGKFGIYFHWGVYSVPAY